MAFSKIDTDIRRHDEGLESRICRNIRFSLDQLMLAGDRDMYTRVLDTCVLGPVSLSLSELCQVLGVNSEMAAGARRKRQDLVEKRPSWLEREREREPVQGQSQETGWGRNQETEWGRSQEPGRGQRQEQGQGRARAGLGTSSLLRSALERQFDLFTR